MIFNLIGNTFSWIFYLSRGTINIIINSIILYNQDLVKLQLLSILIFTFKIELYVAVSNNTL